MITLIGYIIIIYLHLASLKYILIISIRSEQKMLV